MIFGQISRVAIECEITTPYINQGLFGLGFFVIYVANIRFGVYRPDASLLACSIDELARRLSAKGLHKAEFATDLDAASVANAMYRSFYADESAWNLRTLNRDFARKIAIESHLFWAPDGDEAFDDSSYVIQIDECDVVRLIGFRTHDNWEEGFLDLAECRVPRDEFYGLIEQCISYMKYDRQRQMALLGEVGPQ